MIKKFIIRLLTFSLPLVFVLAFMLYQDPFKFFFQYDDYYDSFITPNREMVCYKTFKLNYNENNFNSFIFGSSRSQAFKLQDWQRYLGEKSIPFHFDALGESLYGVRNKVVYLDDLGVKLNNVLFVVDEDLLSKTENRSGHLYISPPELTKESKLDYLVANIKSLISIDFIIAYIDYSIFGTYRSYMKTMLRKAEYKHSNNPINCDFYYGYDEKIKSDSVSFYNKLISQKVFEKELKNNAPEQPTVLEKEFFLEIKRVFDKNNTNYKIVISPLLDRKKMNNNHLKLLYEIFGSEHVFDYSGENNFTESINNYYDHSHYKPNVARKILKEIYLN